MFRFCRSGFHTESTFNMNYWEARTALKDVGKGRNHPFRARCERWNSETLETETGDFLVKAPRDRVIEARDFFYEIVGLRLARLFDVPTARGAIILLEDDFIDDLKDTELGKHEFEAGLGVGCEFIKGLSPLTARTAFREEWLGPARLLYAFDLLMRHDDRGVANPNCGVKNKGLLAYDFERCFQGLEQPAWQVSDQDFVARHIFHRHLMKKPDEKMVPPDVWDEFLERLDECDDARLKGQLHDLPPLWNTPTRQAHLLRHFAEARREKHKLRNELDKCLLKPLPAPRGETP